VMVFGHTHIPMSYRQEGALLVNPGAIASGSAVSRQLCQSVALLYMLNDRSSVVVHVDLATPHERYVPGINWSIGFRAALNRYNGSILDPALEAKWSPYAARVLLLLNDPTDKPAFDALYAALLRVARPCWVDRQRALTHDDLLIALDEAALDPN